jgi:hypothetical protein
MKKTIAFCLLLIASLPALAVEDGQVMYVGGSAPGLTSGTIGRLDTTGETALIFEYSGTKLAIPYADIQSYQYSTEVTRHLGVMPAIAVGLVRIRKHRHYFTISYLDASHVAQAAVFEVPKEMPKPLQAVLQTKAPQAQHPALQTKPTRPCKPSVPCAEKPSPPPTPAP